MYFDLLRNNVVENSYNHYYCALCFEDTGSKYQTREHIKCDRDHLTEQSSITSYVKKTLMAVSCDDVSICIRFAFACVCCNKITPNCESMLQHIRSAKHRKFYYNTIIDEDAVDSVTDEISDDNTETVIFGIDLDNANDYDKYVREKLSDEECHTLVTNGVILWHYCELICDICDRTFNKPYDIWQHVEAKHVREDSGDDDDDGYSDDDSNSSNDDDSDNSNDDDSDSSNDDDSDSSNDDDSDSSNDDDSDIDDDYLWCKLCECSLPSELHVSQHNNGRQHISNKLSKNGVTVQDSTYSCSFCHREFKSLSNTLLHIKGRYHKEYYYSY